MERYSLIYGTRLEGTYCQLDASSGLAPFLSRVGAVNPGAAMNVVRNTLAGFKELEGYYQQPSNDLPVAFRYAPMHLYKREDMPKDMKPFCALAISGAEGRSRASVFSQTILLSREEMHHSVETADGEVHRRFNYLDQIFGTHFPSAVELNDLRNGVQSVNCDALPRKVSPEMRPHDKTVVLQTVQAIYEEKAVVLRLEKGCGFNARAKELLIQIYSLLQPRLAAEIGFAAYQDPSEIQRRISETSMRIFVLPSECRLEDVSGPKILVLDLSNSKSIPALEKNDLVTWLKRWYQLSWERRQQAMEILFADTAATFFDKELFIQRSEDFFRNPYFSWERSDADDGSIATLEELQNKFMEFPLCRQIPWVKERFIQKIPKLLKKGVKLSALTADAAAQGLFSENEKIREKSRQEYIYAADMGGGDVVSACRAAGKLVSVQAKAAAAMELEQEKQKTLQAIAAGEKAVEAEKQNTRRAIANGEAAVEAEKQNTQKAVEEGKNAVEAERQNTVAAIANGQAAVEIEKQNTLQAIVEGQAAVEAEKRNTWKAIADGQAALEAEKRNTEKAVADGLAALEVEKQNTAKAVADGQASVEAEKQNTAKAVADGAAALAAEKENSRKLQAEADDKIEKLRSDAAAAAEKAQRELQQEKNRVDEEIRQGIAQEKKEKDRAVAELYAAQQQFQNAQRLLRDVQTENDQLKNRLENMPKQKGGTEDLSLRFPSGGDGKASEADRMEIKKLRKDLANCKSRMEEAKSAEKKHTIFAAVAGFVAAAVLCSTIFTVITLTREKKPVLNETEVATEQPVTETTAPATTEPTETTIPETTAPLIAGADQEKWMEWVPEIKEIVSDGLQNSADIRGYTPLARFVLADDEDDILLLQGTEQKATDETEAGDIALSEGQVLTMGTDYAVLANGIKDIGISLKIFNMLPRAEDRADVYWMNQENQVNLGKLIGNITQQDSWWREDVSAINTEIDPEAALCVLCGEKKWNIYVFDTDETAVNKAIEFNEAGSPAEADGKYVIADITNASESLG